MAKDISTMTALELFKISRPVWWGLMAAPFILGYTVATPDWDWPLAAGIVYFAICYALLFFGLGDIFGKNSALAPGKRRWLWSMVLVLNAPFWVYFAMQGGTAAPIWLAIMVLAAVAYSVKGLRFREVPLLDAFTFALCWTAPFIFGVLLAGGENLWLPAYLAFFVWAMASHAFSAIQNILPDRAAGSATIATRFGAEKTLVFALSAYLAAAALPTLYYGWKGIFVSVVLLWYVALAISALPFRSHEGHPIFRRFGRLLMIMHYVCGSMISLYLLLLAVQFVSS